MPNYLPESIIGKLKDLLKLRSENDIDSHLNQVKKQGNQISLGDKNIDFLTLMLVKNRHLKKQKVLNTVFLNI